MAVVTTLQLRIRGLLLSVITPSGDGTTFSVLSESADDQDVNLGDLSDKNKVWDKHNKCR